jgi:hypothetical protein
MTEMLDKSLCAFLAMRANPEQVPHSGMLFGFRYASRIMRGRICARGAEANPSNKGMTVHCKKMAFSGAFTGTW